MLRVSKEGPKAGTNKALEISEKALDMWPSGERFTTRNWIPGMVSKPVKKVFESMKFYSFLISFIFFQCSYFNFIE